MQPTSTDSQWQHFANPTLELLSETIGLSGPLRSVRVRIIWHPTDGQNDPQGYTVLEDIDLLSFMQPPSSSSKVGLKSQIQGLPLKAVFRDSIVGFRYLHPCMVPSGSPTYRRFQMCFANSASATQFINSIRHICPCKASPPPATALNKDITGKPTAPTFLTPAKRDHHTSFSNSAPQPVSSQTVVPNPAALGGNVQRQLHGSQPPMTEFRMRMPPVTPVHARTPPQGTMAQQSAHGLQISQFDPLAVSSSTTSNIPFHRRQLDHNPSIPTSPLAAYPLSKEYRAQDNGQPIKVTENIPSRFSQSVGSLSSGSARPPSAPQQIVQPSANFELSRTPTTPNPSALSRELSNRNSSGDSNPGSLPLGSIDFIRDLRVVGELYAMPVNQLEKLVGEVVREPGFLPFLEKLDAMWKIKGFIRG